MTNLTPSKLHSSPDVAQDAGQIGVLIARLSSPDGEVRKQARFALIQIGTPAVEPLMQLCHSADSHLRWEICKILSLIGDPVTVPGLLIALQDDHFEIRWLAAEGLIAIGRKDPEHLKALLHELLKHPNSTWLREGAHHIFHDLAIYNDQGVFKPLVAALADPDWTNKTPVALDEVLNNLAG